MPRIRALLAAGPLVAVCGCTIAQLQQESGQMTGRIAYKEANLTQLEQQRVSLAGERDRLLSDLDNRQVTLRQLDAGLQRLREENGRLTVVTEQQRREKQRVEANLQKLKAEISRLDNDPGPPDQAKSARIEELKKQIKAYLQLMLTQ